MQGLAVPQLKAGDKAGRYELLLQIAQGGMGAVWVARLKLDNGFEKLFAVKTLLTHLADQDVFRHMFLDEARIAAGIEHPNVCQILDMGEEEDLLYLVMEWVEGESVNSLARAATQDGKKVPYGVALRMLSDACAGLHTVHEHRDREGRPLDIVHRDVSPHNMLVSSRGVTKVIDFGVAKARDRLTGATQTGAVKGKLRYMAPEQACGRGVDRRADVWGVGAVLYTLVAGRYPYAGETDVDVLRVMLEGKAPSPLPPSVPEPISRLLQRALAVDPADRPQTAAQLGEELDAAAREMGVTTSQHGVAEYMEANAGARLQRLRTAIHASIEDRESVYTTLKRRSSSDLEEITFSGPTDLEVDRGTQTGTLMGTTSHEMPLSRVWPLKKTLAAMGGIALLASIVLLVTRVTMERTTIPSATAAAPSQSSPSAAVRASGSAHDGIDLDLPPASALPGAAAATPLTPVSTAVATEALPPPPVLPQPVAPPPALPATPDAPLGTASATAASRPPPKLPIASAATPPRVSPPPAAKKRPGLESAIDTRK